MKKVSLISLIIVLIDQIIKYIVSTNISYLDSINIIPNFFSITNVHNTGAAWSLLSGNQIFLILIAIFVLLFLYLFLIKGKSLKTFETIIYGVLIGGIIGNLIDRIVFNYVIDYLDFIIFSYDFPIFNFADMCIVISISILLFLSFKEDLCKKSK